MTDKLAKLIRTITVPPVQVCALFLLLYFLHDGVVTSVSQLLVSLLFLVGVPLLAYPLAAGIPRFAGREGQRKLAFVMSLAGYTGALAYGLFAGVRRSLLLVYLTYFISVVVLTVLNKGLGLRASGHACSITGPLVLAVHFIGWESILPCAAIFIAVIWSSLVLKRHTPRDLFWGSASAVAAFAIASVL